MQKAELSSQLQIIHSLIRRTREATGDNIELQGHWGKYLCILAAGFLENAHRILYSDFISRASSEPVARYTTRYLESVQNPKASRFVDTARAFNRNWGDELEIFLDSDGRREAIDSIMNNRHLIAHGRTTSISVARVREYLDKSVEALEFIERQLS